jgi:chromate transporter
MMQSQETVSSTTPAAAPPGLLAIFWAFLRLGCTSFGGGTAGWLHRDIVLRRRWLDDPAFLAMLTVGQALPGSNGTKLTVLIGQHLRGTAGAAVALFALLAGPFAIVLAVAGIYAGLTGLTFATGLRSAIHGASGPAAWAMPR